MIGFSVSPYTETFWNEFLINPKSCEYNLVVDQAINGPLDIARLENAIAKLVEENILFSHVLSDSGDQLRWVPGNKSIILEQLDPSCDMSARVKAPFDLRSGPLCRFMLVRHDAHHHDFIVIVHHILLDGLSGQEFIDALSHYYNHRGQQPLGRKNRETIDEQNARLRQEISRLRTEFNSVDFWQEMLAGCQKVNDIPKIHRNTLPGQIHSSEVRFHISYTQWNSLKSGVKYASHFLIFKTLWATLLARMSEEKSVCIGYPVSIDGGSEMYYGAQVNMGIFPLSLSAGSTFRDIYQLSINYIRKIKASGKLRHTQLPIYEVIRQTGIQHLNVNFSQAYLKDAPFSLEGCQLSINNRFNIDLSGSELLLEYQPADDGFDFRLRYRTDLFDEHQMVEMSEQYCDLLNAALQQPDRPLSDFPLITAQQESRLRDQWSSQLEVVIQSSTTLLSGFEQHASRHPERIALRDEQGSLSYGELSQRVDRLASQLHTAFRQLTGEPMLSETLIPLFIERTNDAVIGMLAIMKAGGAYVPLDPHTPQQRLSWILQDVASPIILTQTSLQDRARSGAENIHCLLIDALAPCNDDGPVVHLPRIDNRQLAYVIYTSGTTGRPKGTLCEHRGAINTILGHTRRILADERGVLNCLQFATLAFDAHVYEVFIALHNGHSLHIASEQQRKDLQQLTQQMAAWQIHFCFLPPALLSTCPAFPESVRYIGMGGESVAEEVLNHYLAQGMRVSNLYGPTEASVSVSVNLYQHNGARNIGCSIDNMRCYVVNERGHILPTGVVGDLCLSGIGLARGYLNLPELTASTFTDNLLEEGENYQRFYRSGDKARRLPDGSMEYCGRQDQQVKIHGHRIELGEIESVMRAIPGVQGAVAAVQSEPVLQLRAWYVLSPGSTLTAEKIIQVLKLQLPLYMIPGAMRAIAAIPLTLNSKVDYKALPEPQSVDSYTHYRAPANALESQLLALLNQLLKCQAGTDDHFFALGGDSILAIRYCHEIYKRTGLHVSPLTLSEYPTVATLSHQLALSNETVPQVTIPAMGRDSGPLSFQQSQLWFMAQLSAQATHYLTPLMLQLDPTIDCERLAISLQALVARHQVLRSLIVQDEQGEASQQVTQQTLTVAQKHLPTEDHVTASVEQALQQPFNLKSEIPIRATIYHYQDVSGTARIACLLVFHHIAFDGWSLNVVMRELDDLYQHFGKTASADPVVPERQYLDYALWQQQQAANQQSALDFWLRALDGLQPLDIPMDFSRPAFADVRGDNVEVLLPAALIEALRALARRQGVTLHAVTLAGFVLLLSRYTGQDDVVVGSPLANRGQAELENLIGFFVNTLPLRHQLDNQLSVAEFIRQVADNTRQVQQHQDMSLKQLVDHLAIARDFSHHPLFQVMFSLESEEHSDAVPQWLSLVDLSEKERTAKFDLTLTLKPCQEGMRARFNFASALFRKSTISRLAHYYLQMLQQLIEHEERPLAAAGLGAGIALSPPKAAFDYHFERPLHQDFIRHAQQNPQAAALFDDRGEMSYGELYQAAQMLATQLRLQGEVTGEAVAILADKGRQQPVAILAVLMCGKAFLPMDKAWPLQRRLAVMAQAGINTVLSSEAWATEAVKVILLDRRGLASELPLAEQLLPPVEVAANDLAYIIFTSGSGGTPKGVAIEHRSAVNTLEGVQRRFSIDKHDRSLALSAMSFDLAIWDIFAPLSVGGAVVMPAEQHRASPQAWYQLMMSHRVTLWLSAPALLELLLDYVINAGSLDRPRPALRLVMVGGDWIATSLPERCRQWAPDCQFCSAGGATEAAIFSILYEVPPEKVLTVSIPYGRALPHEQFYVLDRWLRPVPEGVKGELFIAGEGLARGYYHDEERTNASFFWHHQLQQRVYRTGDYGRFLSDGNIEFMGRIDQQVKINGYRVELGEIENVVLAYPRITGCCVILTSAPQRVLVAYITASEEIDIVLLLQQLRAQLPQYMVPKTIMQLEQIPLTLNGKVARDLLPPAVPQAQAFVEAASHEETICCDIWRELLNVEPIGVEDNFFALGGNSLLAIQASYQLSRRLKKQVTLSEIGQYPTIRSLCAYLAQSGPQTAGISIPAQQRDRWPLSYSQMQLWFIENLNGGSNLYHVPMLFRLAPGTDIDACCHSLQAIVARHEVLRSVIHQQQAQLAESVRTDAALEVARMMLSAGEWPRQLQQDIDRPFNLSTEIPTRATIYQVYEGNTLDVYCLVVIHHLAFDGWSQALFIRELAELYPACCLGSTLPLSAPALQYGDYACWQREYLDSGRAQALKNFWRDKLHNWQPLELPLDYPRPAKVDHRGANYCIRLPTELGAQCEHFVQQHGVTPFALFLASFNLLLSYFSGQQDILVGTPVANRPTEEVHNVIGFFVNTLPLRSQIDDDITLAAYIQGVFDQVMEIQQYQGLPLDQLIDMMKVPRDLASHPLFQVMFLLEDEEVNPSFPDWLIPQSLNKNYQVAKFDMTLSVQKKTEGTQLIFNYATALFSAETIEYLARYYLRILQQLVNHSRLHIKEMHLIDSADVLRQRAEWQSSLPQYDFERAIHHDFIQHARRQPQKVALIDSDGALSYGELYQAALHLSLQLRQFTDMEAETIAVMVDKGRAQIIAVMAILMAGRAYLPLDGSWPERRRRAIISQSQTRVIISSAAWQSTDNARLLAIDSHGCVAELPQPQPGEPVFAASGELAYVIFTSGSTGAPKGVAVEHRGAVNSIVDTLRQLSIGPHDRGLALSALSFDISAFDIFGILSAGATMVIPSEAQRYQPDAWHRLMIEHDVTFWNSAPSVMTLLVEYLESGVQPGASWPALRNVVLVGEVISRQLPARIRQWQPHCRISSTGGATESSIWSIIYEIPDGPILAPSVPYGKAMAHQRFYVLDRHMGILPPCLPGEQYIGGAGVAREYYRNRPLTDERFIWHPVLGERLYRTGDAGRYLPDGNLEFLGRMDFQVKLNGYRVELGEVEDCAMAFSPIKSCCAIVRNDDSQQRLVLYYVCEEPLVEVELLEFMSQQLPLYMIPTALVRLDALPLSSSGKLDRKALPAPASSSETDYVAPKNALEAQLCALWQETLHCERIGMTDDFFRAGGTSIIAISLCIRLAEILGSPVPVVKLFQCRTLKNLLASQHNSLVIALNTPAPGASALWMIHPALVGAEAFYPFAQAFQGRINCFGIDNYNLYHRPPIDSLPTLAARYLDEMTAHGLLSGSSPVQIVGWSLGGLIALEVAALLEARGVGQVSLYLLDSFYQQAVGEQPSSDLLSALGITAEAAQRAMAIAGTEQRLAQGVISRRLMTTRVTLFKATQPNPQLPDDVMRELLAVQDNGLQQVCEDLTVIPLACHHHNILQCAEEIGEVIIRNKEGIAWDKATELLQRADR